MRGSGRNRSRPPIVFSTFSCWKRRFTKSNTSSHIARIGCGSRWQVLGASSRVRKGPRNEPTHAGSLRRDRGSPFRSIPLPRATRRKRRIRAARLSSGRRGGGRRHAMRVRGNGFWEIFVPDAKPGAKYKYEIIGPDGHLLPLKSDPLAFAAELRPQTASIVVDQKVIGRPQASPAGVNALSAPISIYEVHLGSWRPHPQDGGRWLSYRELAEQLPAYAHEMGFTHVEFLPVSEHPFDGSWGYQPTGLFAPTSRLCAPADFAALIDACHRKNLAVILDWVPGHFPDDPHGLSRFDGTALYEHENPQQGRHLDWNTLIYKYGRTEIANFLLANGLFWLDRYNIDGLRVDAVASMLYLDYSRPEGGWIPNKYGGRENIDAINLLRRFNTEVFSRFPNATTAAAESTALPVVSRPVEWGGLGYGYKWNMGWMHDTLEYISKDPLYRKHHHGQILFGLHYAFFENFVLPLSHDEVVHGKRSLLGRM